MKWVLSTLLLIFSFQFLVAQVPDTIYDLNLNAQPSSNISGGKFILINNNSCVSCVDYVVSCGFSNDIVILVNQFSLSEVMAIVDQYSLYEQNVYFSVLNPSNKMEKSPMIVKNYSKIVAFSEIDKISNNFRLAKEEFMLKIESEIISK